MLQVRFTSGAVSHCIELFPLTGLKRSGECCIAYHGEEERLCSCRGSFTWASPECWHCHFRSFVELRTLWSSLWGRLYYGEIHIPWKASGKTSPSACSSASRQLSSVPMARIFRGQVTFRVSALYNWDTGWALGLPWLWASLQGEPPTQCHMPRVTVTMDVALWMLHQVQLVPYRAEEREGCLHGTVGLCSKTCPPRRAPRDRWPGDSASCSLGLGQCLLVIISGHRIGVLCCCCHADYKLFSPFWISSDENTDLLFFLLFLIE